MRKCIAFLLVLVMALSMSVTAFAESGDISIEAEDPVAFGKTTIKPHVYSSCSIYIPSTVEFSNVEPVYAWHISDGNLEAGYQIGIYICNLNEDGMIDLFHDYKEITTACQVYSEQQGIVLSSEFNTLAIFKDTDFSETGRKDFYYRLYTQGTRAGTYTGTIQYEIRIEPYSEG